MPEPLSHLIASAGGSSRLVALARLLLLLALHAISSCASRDRIVYWNASNPLFQQTGENVLLVSLQDRINFICPDNGVEYYQIYWTPNQDQMKSCSGGSVLFSCRRMDSYLVYVQIFPADPTAPGFLNPVYFYTPSTGDLSGLDQATGGACLSRNMRITVRTGDSAQAATSASSATVTTAPTSTTIRQPQQQPQTISDQTSDGQRSTTDSRSTPTSGFTVEAPAPATGTSNPQTAARQTTATAGRVPERLDSTRTLNLITGASVARATVATVASLTCFSALLLNCCG